MEKAIVIINGIRFPHFLVERAIKWAKKEGAQLHALFLISGEEMPEEYAFPSDIDLAENIADTEDSKEDSMSVLRHQVSLFRHMLEADGLAGSAEMMNNPSLEQVLKKIQPARKIFVAPDYGEITLQAITRFSLHDLVDRLPVDVEVAQ